MLLLNDNDARRLLTMRETIEVVEEAFKELAKGTAIMLPRTTLMLDKYAGSISQMTAYLKGMNAMSTKVISIFPNNMMYDLPTTIATIIVNDARTGKVIAIMDAAHLTAMRTGAVSGVATKYLARKDATIAGIIGCGVQGRTQIWAAAEVRELEKVKAYDVSVETRKEFARVMSRRLGIDVISVNTAEKAVKNSDIIITATTSVTPVLEGKWLGEGAHINAIGSFYPHARELDGETILRSKVIVDLKEAALAEAGDLIIPIKEGVITEHHIYAELGEIVVGEKPGRSKDDEITLFKSVGLAIQDAAAAKLLVEKALTCAKKE